MAIGIFNWRARQAPMSAREKKLAQLSEKAVSAQQELIEWLQNKLDEYQAILNRQERLIATFRDSFPALADGWMNSQLPREERIKLFNQAVDDLLAAEE